jgi:hypothetical protein
MIKFIAETIKQTPSVALDIVKTTARGVVTGALCTVAATYGAVAGATVAAYTVAKQRGV